MVAISEFRIAQRVQTIGESATLAVDARAKALQASGAHVIGFGAGEPDFPTPAHIVEAAAAAAADPANHHYTPTGGLPELRSAIAAKTERDSGYACAPDQVVVCNGGKHALFNTFLSIIDPGDEVIVPAPYWVSYPEMIRLAGGTVVEVVTTAESGFKASLDQLEAARTERTKVLLFVSPSNPTGAVYSPEQVEAVGRWALEHGLWVVTDEIYEHLVYGDARFSSMPVLVPDLADRCIVINGVAKTYAMTGWRVGWLIAPGDVARAVIRLQSHATSNVANVAQAAALAAVSGTLDAAFEMREAFDRRRRAMHKMLSDIEGLVCVEPEGAFYEFPSFEAFLGRSIAGHPVSTTLELAEVVLDAAKVAFVPGEAFGAPGYGRLSYAMSDEDMIEGLTRIADLLATAT